jgi:hypothetical protein
MILHEYVYGYCQGLVRRAGKDLDVSCDDPRKVTGGQQGEGVPVTGLKNTFIEAP